MSDKVLRTMQHEGKEVPVLDLKTIDFGKLLSNEPAEIQKLLRSCEEEGFFYVDLRGIDGRRTIDDEQRLLELMRCFFGSSLEEKNEIGLPEQKHGYEPIGLHAGLTENSRDGYECLKVALSELASSSPNLPSILNNEDDIKILRDFSAGGDIITKTILSCLSNAMGLTGTDRLETLHRSSRPSNSTLAMFRYIPGDLATQARQNTVGHQQHTDIGSLTLLFSEQYGLQLQPAHTPNAAFGFVEPRPGHAIINVGDSLRFASKHRLYSCIHHVVPFHATADRYSIAYFLRPEVDALYKDSEGRWVTAGQWHDEKYDVFRASHAEQASVAPKTMLLGGMPEHVSRVAVA
ncbi:Uu.00g141470.m01.CDS01 [Anthostomella pinea]|uniref:Uu.00g141470.m01.CDS01 n=1 Tax=Anthostomella pinea TaxID=933095 RepID=A0AAI8YJ29_9PEZI|nr:Uu.00g141470.m01.CDS01 [Anthostomella pinea]